MTRILVVEDEPGIALALEDDLKLEGYDVEVRTDGESGLTRALEGRFDLLILDVMLPRRDGFEVCRSLRRAGSRTPVIILTARAQESDKILGLDLGADDYVSKPFSPRELRARVKAVLRRGLPDAPQTYVFGDMEVDLTRHELRKQGTPVDVTPLEFKLLSVLIRHRSQALSRERLLDEVWGRETYVTDRVIDTHVTNLRKKIEPEPAQPRYLVSIRGHGYRFDG